MKIKVKVLPGDSTREIDLKPGSKVYDLLDKIQLRPDATIVLRGDIPIPIDDALEEDEELRILQVASGG